jgi:hypothetical protein
MPNNQGSLPGVSPPASTLPAAPSTGTRPQEAAGLPNC